MSNDIPAPAPKPLSQQVQAFTNPTTQSYPNLFMSPFGNDGIIPTYSSIPIRSDFSGDCLPCVICGNSQRVSEILAVESKRLQSELNPSIIVGLS
jgi:hypothetical protein